MSPPELRTLSLVTGLDLPPVTWSAMLLGVSVLAAGWVLGRVVR